MKCSHAKAKSYLNKNIVSGYGNFVLQVRCGRCKQWIGEKPTDYPLPADLLKITKIHFIK